MLGLRASQIPRSYAQDDIMVVQLGGDKGVDRGFRHKGSGNDLEVVDIWASSVDLLQRTAT